MAPPDEFAQSVIDLRLLGRIEAYMDAVPRNAAEPEAVGKFTLFRPLGPWKYYARPTLGLEDDIEHADVDALRVRQRELKLPENIEWVNQTTPSLAAAAGATGLVVHEYPMLVLDNLVARAVTDDGFRIRQVNADDDDFALVHAVAMVGFGAPGTAAGPEGPTERDASAVQMKPDLLEFIRERHRRGWSVTFAAFDATGPVAVGTHQQVNGVTEIVGVATLPIARRRGLGAAVTNALAADAIGRGVTTVFMSADNDAVARVYEHVGFVRVGSTGVAEPPSD